MNGNLLLAVVVLWPILASIIAYAIGKNINRIKDALVIFVTTTELALTLYMAFTAFGSSFSISICAINFELDGFRAIYAVVIALMWFMTSLFSAEYMKSYQNTDRYYFFYLFTLGATMGVFLSADLYTTLLFFEVMSFTSYAWVAHDETDKSLRAANTYLAIAIIGGLVSLMGLFLIYDALGTLKISELYTAAQALSDKTVLYIAGGCMLFGFGAKAGMFPLHVWLPKAHPVAPAPASALLSGILTKTGVYGVLIVSCDILRYDPSWGIAVLVFGVLTMFFGALLALFSTDLKRTLACSSMSQIGFILIAIAMQCLLGQNNAAAASGTVLHMVNHSIIKLDLFMVAGVVYMNTHHLDLNSLRGWGKGKPLLNIAFLLGLLGIAGVPLFNGYISKTLIHDAIIEYAAIGGAAYTVVEWLFLISGGITLAYMLKLYICIFIEGEKPEKTKYMNKLSTFAILGSALLIPVLGVIPHLTSDKLAVLSESFMHSAHATNDVVYFSLNSLKGALISLIIGAILYLIVVRKLLMKKENGVDIYLDRWPKKLDLEEGLYRPLILKWLPNIFGGIVDFIGNIPEGIIYLLRMTIYKDSSFVPKEHKKYALAHSIGVLIDKICELFKLPKKKKSYANLATDAATTISETSRGIESNLSFALLMACIGICAAIIYLLVKLI